MATEIYVNYNEHTYHSEYSTERYGPWSESKDYEVTGVSLEKPKNTWQYEKVTVDFDPNQGEAVFVVYMIYSSGDSFGNSTGNGEIIWVFDNYYDACEAAKAIRQNKDEYTIKFTTTMGVEIQMSNPASGYFEDLSSVYVEMFKIDDPHSGKTEF